MSLGLTSLLSSSSTTTSSSPMPVMTFFGPDNLSQIKAIAPTGQEVACFTVQGTSKSSFTIIRTIYGPNAPPAQICSAEKSSLSSSTSMIVHGQHIKVQPSSDGMGDTVLGVENSKIGPLKWRRSSGGEMKLVDNNKTLVAGGSIEEAKLEVFVPADEMVLDIVLATWVVVLKKKKAAAGSSGSGSGMAAVHLVSALLGAGG